MGCSTNIFSSLLFVNNKASLAVPRLLLSHKAPGTEGGKKDLRGGHGFYFY